MWVQSQSKSAKKFHRSIVQFDNEPNVIPCGTRLSYPLTAFLRVPHDERCVRCDAWEPA